MVDDIFINSIILTTYHYQFIIANMNVMLFHLFKTYLNITE